MILNFIVTPGGEKQPHWLFLLKMKQFEQLLNDSVCLSLETEEFGPKNG